MMKFLLSVITLLLISTVTIADNNERDKYDREVDRVAFASKISGTTWLYSWRDREYTFAFEPNGDISKLESWSKVKWYTNQKDEVVLEAPNNKMYLYFDTKVRNFKTVDWDGQDATGKIIFKDDK